VTEGTTVVCVQPQEPVPGPMAPPPEQGTTPAAPAKKPRNRRLRLWLAVSAGVLSLLCLGGIGVAVLIYDDETKIERTQPDVVADNFLRAYLVTRNENEVALFACRSGGDFSELQAYRTDIQNREAQFSIGIRVAWEGLRVTTNGAQGSVDADLTRSIQDGTERITDKWRLGLVDEDGWRVCSAAKIG
jgi:hypothetical protein